MSPTVASFTISQAVLTQKSIWLLARMDPGDVILAGDLDPKPLEARRAALGKLSAQYEVIQVPLREKPDA